MKFIHLLLAMMVGVVRGDHLCPEVRGVSNTGVPFCSEDVQKALYDECVVDEADSMGFNNHRRLELSANRELGHADGCGGCVDNYPMWHYCHQMNCMHGSRRLSVAGEHVHTARFLSEKEQLEDAAVDCLRQKITEGLECLGNKDDLSLKIVLSDPVLPDPVDLGSARNYAVLAKSGISTVPNSVITGDIGVSSVTSTGITGFALVPDSSGEFSTSLQVVGKVYAPEYSGMTAAVSAMEVAYTDVAIRPTTGSSWNDIGGSETPGTISGKTLTPGVYTFTVADVSIYSDLAFCGDADDIFVIQIAGDLAQTVNTHVLLEGGAQAKNIFWQVAGNVEIGAGASMQGILLVQKKVDFITGSSLVGRVLAQTAVNLQMANINGTTCD